MMKPSEIVNMLMKPEDMIGQTFHFRIRSEHLERVVQSWSMLMNRRPAIQLRDVKGTTTMFVEHFVLSVTIEDQQQALWAQMLMDLEGTKTHQQ